MANKPKRVAPPVPTKVDVELVQPAAEVSKTGMEVVDGDPQLMRLHSGVIQAAKMGKAVESLGMVRTVSGYILMSKEMLTKVLARLATQAEGANGAKLALLARSAASVGNTVAKLAREASGGIRPGPAPRRGGLRAGFAVGKPISITQNNFYGGPSSGKPT